MSDMSIPRRPSSSQEGAYASNTPLKDNTLEDLLKTLEIQQAGTESLLETLENKLNSVLDYPEPAPPDSAKTSAPVPALPAALDTVRNLIVKEVQFGRILQSINERIRL